MVVSAVAGKPGVGKSALAVHLAYDLAEKFPDGQLYINLRGADDQPLSPDAALEEFLQRFAIRGDAMPKTLDGKAAMYRRQFAGKQMLVVLDNAASEQQVRPLLPGTPACAAIVTSRQVLAALDATSVELDVLDKKGSVLLLGRVAGKRVRNEPEAATKVAELCGHLPLALRIAGAKLVARRHWTVAYLAERLADERRRLAELGEGDLDVRACFALSYVDLPAEDARAFRLLGLIPGPDFGPKIVTDILDLNREAAELQLDRLARLQLLESASSPHRYRFHDLLRLYARERLESDEAPATRAASFDRMLTAYTAMAEVHEGLIVRSRFHTRVYGLDGMIDLSGTSKAQRVATFEAEWENILAAMETVYRAENWWGAWRIAEKLADLLFHRGYWHDCERTAHVWANAIAAGGTWGRREIYSFVHAYLILGRIYSSQGHWRQAVTYLQHALDLNEPSVQGELLYELGQASAALRRWDDAKAYYHQSCEVFQEEEASDAVAMVLIGLGKVHRAQRDWKTASDYCGQSLKQFVQDDDLEGQALATFELGNISSDLREWENALRWYEQSITSWRQFRSEEFGNKSGEAVVLNSIGTVHRHQHRWNDALGSHQGALEDFRLLGMRDEEARALVNIGRVYADQGRVGEAIPLWEEAITILVGLGSEDEELYQQAAEAGSLVAAVRLGVLLSKRDPFEAERWLREAADAGDPGGQYCLGVVLATQGKLDEAEQWYRRATDAGNLDAAVNLGVLVGGRDPAEAERLLRMAAVAGDHDGEYNLAALLGRQGRREEADGWLRKAANSGHHYAESMLGSMLAEQGELEEAKRWWGKAEGWLRTQADAGNQHAEFTLGVLLYQQGRLDEAEVLWRRAADAGALYAAQNLGVLLQRRGEGEEAERWFRKASAQRDSDATTE